MKILLISFLLCSNIYSQSVKKVFKEIKNNHIEEAIIESEKTNSRDKFDEEEKTLFQLGKCLLLSNEVSTIFKPYEAYSLFKSISISKQDEVNDFLAKYELSLDKISDLIFKGILVEAKKNNTVSSYEAALKVCKPCNYEIELNDLKSDAAYIEAKNLMTFKSMNNFILNYPKSKHILVATDIRDSIALIKTNKDYISLLKYTKKYPKSKFTPKVIQELPDLLYKEAMETNTVESLKRFLGTFPKDKRCKDIDEKLSKIRYTEISLFKSNKRTIDSDCEDIISYSVFNNVGFKNGLASVIVKGKICIVDEKGKIIIPGKYDFIGDFNEGLASVCLNRKCGYVDEKGEEITALKYDYHKALGGFNQGEFNEGLVWVSINNKYGYIDKTGKEIIPLKFDLAHDFKNGLAKVQLNGKFGFIDKTGNEIIPFKYDLIGDFNEGLALVCLNRKYGLINQSGIEITPIKYDNSLKFNEDLAVVTINGKSGFIDKTGKEIIPIKYNSCESFNEGLAIVTLNGKFGYINKTGKEIIPIKYDFAFPFQDGLAVVAYDNKNRYIDKSGKEITSINYKTAYPFQEGFAIVGDEIEHKFGFINKTGKELTLIKYEFADNFKNGIAEVGLNGKYGLIDKAGKEIIPCQYQKIGYFNEGISKVQLDGKFGFIDNTGKVIIPIKYDFAYNFNNGLAQVSLNRKYGIIDKSGEEIIPIKYDNIDNFHEDKAFAIENCELKIITLYKHELNKMEFSSPDQLNEINANDDNLDEQEKHNKQTVDNNIKINSEVNNQITAQIYTMTDESPEFPGGISEFQKYITANINIPQSAIDNGYKGKCFLKFVVTDNGSITNIQIIRGVPNCTECNEEAKRLINQMPKWKPGKVQNRAVYSTFQIPINFDF